jgi:tripartite-type tricarboxylate transporter receptor subunit TctC
MRLRTAFALLAAALAFTTALADDAKYPSRPVTLVVPYPPGGSNDVFARELGKRLSDEWKVPVVVDNRPGAGGNIGAGYVTHAKPDGYTIMLLSSSFTTNAAIQPDLPFDPVAGFTPITMVAKGPMILTVRNTLPVHSLLEFLAYARKNPGRLNYGSSGIGSTNHFATVLLEEAANIRMTHVPYKGMNPAVTDVIGGNIDVLIASAPSIGPMAKAGKVRAIGVTSPGPSAVIPEYPSIARSGVPGYSFELWWGVLAPPKLPPQLVERLNHDINAILATDEMKKIIAREGAEASPMPSAQFAKTVADEIAQWKRVAQRANIKPE